MAGEIRTRYSSTGATIYRQIVRASDGYIYNGSAFSAVPTAASWSSYSSALVEQSTTQYYYGTFPAVSAGLYNVYIYIQSGGSPATTDTLLEVQTIDWKGSAEVTLSTLAIGGGGTVTVGSINDDSITATSITSEAKQSIADTILGRSVSTIEGTASEHSLCTLILGALESSVSGTTWTIKRTNGSTTHYTKTLTTGDADPITGVS